MATLSGSLQSLNLPDVLRLVASTGKSGLLYVDGDQVIGKLYFFEGELTYATTRTDHAFLDGTDDERRIVDVDRISEDQTSDLLKQQLTDVFVRLVPLDSGTFEFEDGTMPPIDSGFSFDIEAVLQAAEERLREWNRITEVLPSPTTEVRLNPEIQGDDVTLDARSWAVVAALTTEATANAVAKELRIFEFAAAKKIAELIRRGLVSVVEAWDDLPRDGLTLDREDPETREEKEPESTPATEAVEEAAVDETEPEEPDEEDREPPAGELARRWRELSSARQRGEG